jgi:hypothetical protein
MKEQITTALGRHPAVAGVRLTGSRAEGRSTRWSDWDFVVETTDFDAIRDELPALSRPLRPLAHQWDPLSSQYCWMLVLPGAVKVDLIFPGQSHEIEAPREPTAANLAAIDAHFWDWVLWLSGKQAAGHLDVVATELRALSAYILAPLGAKEEPASVKDAVAVYRLERDRLERRFGSPVPRALGREVSAAIAERGGNHAQPSS